MPTDDSELWYSKLRAAMLQLTSDVFNINGLNVVALATVLGAVPLIEEFLNTPEVYRFRDQACTIYDITYLTPQTFPGNSRTSKSKMTSVVDVAPDDLRLVSATDKTSKPNPADPTASHVASSESCLDLIVEMEDEILAARILDVNPFRQLVQNYWDTYQWLYGILMLIHIIYMTVYTVFVLPNSSTILGVYNTTGDGCRTLPSSDIYGLFLIWPCIILAFFLYYTVTSVFRYLKTVCRCGRRGEGGSGRCGWLPRRCRLGVFSLPRRLLSAMFSYVAQLSALAFGIMSIVWYAFYRCGTTAHVYVEVVSAVFALGWMFSLQFTKGFQTMHAFSIMLKYIVLRDITRFLIMYVFVLLGFGFAFHALFQLSPTIADPIGSPFNTLFIVFNLMLGLGESPIDSNFDESYEASGGNPAFVKWFFIMYVAMSTIILLSLLIAMMTDTFTDIKSKEATTWQVGSLRLALRIERTVPFLRNAVCCSGRDRVTFDPDIRRWMMSTGAVGTAAGLGGSSGVATGARGKEEMVDELLKMVKRLDNKLDHLQNAYVDLSRQVDTVAEVVQRQTGADVSIARGRRPAGVPSLYSVAMMLRHRPVSASTRKKARNTKV